MSEKPTKQNPARSASDGIYGSSGSSDPADSKHQTPQSDRSLQDGPSTSKDSGNGKSKKKNKKEKMTVEAFQPGKYPVIFDCTSESVAVVDISTQFDASKIFEQSTTAYDALQHHPEMEEYVEHVTFAVGGNADRVHRAFVASSALSAAQNIVNSTRANNRDFDGLTYVTRSDVIAPETMNMVCTQYGFFTHPETRENYIPTNLSEQIYRFVRIAHNIENDRRPLTSNLVRHHATGTGWLPSHVNDPSWDLILKDKLRKWFKANGIHWIDITPTPLWQEPPWWGSLTAAQQSEILLIFQPRPTTEVKMLQRINSFTQQWFFDTGTSLPVEDDGTTHRFYTPDDLRFQNWRQNLRTWWTTLANKWTSQQLLFAKFLTCSATKSARSDNASVATLGKVIVSGPTLTYRSPTPVPMAEANIHVAFPAEVFVSERLHENNAVISVSRDLQHERIKWIQSGLKT